MAELTSLFIYLLFRLVFASVTLTCCYTFLNCLIRGSFACAKKHRNQIISTKRFKDVDDQTQ